MNMNEVFSGNYLKADDLKGASPRVTIAKVEMQEFDNGNKLIVSFQGKDKCLVLNKTNASIIAENIGSQETDDWIGQTIQLCVKKVEYKGEIVPAIRVVLQDTPAPAPVRQARKAERPPADPENDGRDEDNEVPFN